jgi:glycosyltransferase involved in cell wall biosynthesis
MDMRRHYAAAGLVVVPVRPTLRACGMNVVLEAWAMSKGVIASETPGLRDYLEDGRTVRFVQPGDPVELRRAILELLDDTMETARLGANGRLLVEAELNLDAYVARVALEIESCLNERLAGCGGHARAPRFV